MLLAIRESIFDINTILIEVNSRFFIDVPLKILTGFAESFKKVIGFIKQELLFIRPNSDNDAIVATEVNHGFKLIITNIT